MSPTSRRIFPKALLLDFDHTLMDNRVIPASIELATTEIAATFPGVTPERLLAENAAAFGAYWREMESLCANGQADVLDVSLEAWRRTMEACGFDRAAGREAFDIHQRIGNEMARLFDDVPEFLENVQALGVRTALITNSSVKSQTAKIELMGLTSAFDAVVISGEHGIVKPDQRIFEVALRKLECAPSEAWHVGDSLSTDVAGALGSGIVAVWLNRDHQVRTSTDPRPDIEVSSLTQLAGFLGS